ncbi:DUF998 domain-containing protein [Palaeococcus ferrophilus]|uniref:DUF998 domain-containing protein n=1 Tax=Palaeococcus ferrophilus TaxID=83868 RepID=UPI00064FE97D|nr:DUF998 domain-containing protein [Palaeococcus ferrophilus]
MRRSQLYAGLTAPLVSFSGIALAILVNRSWWSLTDNAISDLGRVGLPHNWLLNLPLILTALLGIYYAIGLLGEMRNRVEKAGVGVFTLGLVFLALIGAFPEGTSPHYTVSWGFFLFASLGYLIIGLGLWMEGHRNIGTFTVLLFITEVLLTRWAFGTFRGIAIPEFIAALSVVTWHYTTLASVGKDYKSQGVQP